MALKEKSMRAFLFIFNLAIFCYNNGVKTICILILLITILTAGLVTGFFNVEKQGSNELFYKRNYKAINL